MTERREPPIGEQIAFVRDEMEEADRVGYLGRWHMFSALLARLERAEASETSGTRTQWFRDDASTTAVGEKLSDDWIEAVKTIARPYLHLVTLRDLTQMIDLVAAHAGTQLMNEFYANPERQASVPPVPDTLALAESFMDDLCGEAVPPVASAQDLSDYARHKPDCTVERSISDVCSCGLDALLYPSPLHAETREDETIYDAELRRVYECPNRKYCDFRGRTQGGNICPKCRSVMSVVAASPAPPASTTPAVSLKGEPK